MKTALTFTVLALGLWLALRKRRRDEELTLPELYRRAWSIPNDAIRKGTV